MGRALATALIAMLPACAQVEAPGLPQNAESAFVKRVRQVFARVPATLAKNHKTFAVPDGLARGFAARLDDALDRGLIELAQGLPNTI